MENADTMIRVALTGAAVAAASALVATVVIGRSSPPPAPDVSKAWADRFETAVMNQTAVLPKADRIIEIAAPTPVPVQPVVPESAKVPPIIPVEEPAKKQRIASTETNLCTRHNMQKIWVSKYKWRCRKN